MAKQVKDAEHKGIVAKAVDAIEHALNPEAPVPNAEPSVSENPTEAVEAKVKASEPCPGDYVERKKVTQTTILGDLKHD